MSSVPTTSFKALVAQYTGTKAALCINIGISQRALRGYLNGYRKVPKKVNLALKYLVLIQSINALNSLSF